MSDLLDASSCQGDDGSEKEKTEDGRGKTNKQKKPQTNKIKQAKTNKQNRSVVGGGAGWVGVNDRRTIYGFVVR